MEVLKFEDIHYIRQRRPILKGIDWTIKEGEQWALIGLNGSGKSTLLGMIPAYTYASKGKVTVFGNQFGRVHWDKVRKDLGYVSSVMNYFNYAMKDNTTIDIIKSGVENTFGFYRDLDQDQDRRAEDLVGVFSLDKVKDKEYHTLSQGERRRTLLARAFMNNPKLMVLDEPTTGLDLSGREMLLGTLQRYCQEEKKPLIYVTHSLEEIMPAISHVAIMDDGKINIKGPKEEVLTKENLSQLYGLDLEVEVKYGRYWVKVLGPLAGEMAKEQVTRNK